ncbi:MAG: hypothetical protein IT379_22080 [Deltaproteobacteria bacterium]|nr:hypothetical protein [Deltaproteobacteria bacterium]
MKKKSNTLLIVILAFVAIFVLCGTGLALIPLVAGGALFGAFAAYEHGAPPIQKLEPYVESSPRVQATLGAPVDVSMTITRVLRREMRPDGSDHVNLMTTVSGSRQSGLLTANAQNHGGQGWAGTWSLRTDSRRVLRDGQYRVEGGDLVASGTFAPDGSPRE